MGMVTLAAVLLKNLKAMKHVFIIINASKTQKSLNDPHKPMPSTLNPKPENVETDVPAQGLFRAVRSSSSYFSALSAALNPNLERFRA